MYHCHDSVKIVDVSSPLLRIAGWSGECRTTRRWICASILVELVRVFVGQCFDLGRFRRDCEVASAPCFLFCRFLDVEQMVDVSVRPSVPRELC